MMKNILQMNHSCSFLYSLKILKLGRITLVNRFLKKDPKLYRSMFKYRKNSGAMDLCKDKFILEWIDNHFKIMKINPANSEQEKLNAIKRIGLLMKGDGNTVLFYELSLQKIKIIDSLLSSEESMEEKFNELELSYDRDKDLFERKFEKLLSQNDE
jgi:hypothetical protein